MKKVLLFENYKGLWKEYKKFSQRIKNKMKNGSFWRLTFEKRNALLKKLATLRNRLSVLNPDLKPLAAAAVLTLAVNIPSVYAQSFTELTGIDNPVNSVVVDSYSEPAFADLDHDGDQDLIIGTYYGTIEYFLNTGSSSSPVFTQKTGTSNPFSGITPVGGYGYFAPAFADLDNDGDFDMILGQDQSYDYSINSYSSKLRYFRNTGTSTAPVFTEQTGGNDLFSSTTSENFDELDPVLVDIDHDGDMDIFVGEEDTPGIFYFKNTGTATVPQFTLQNDANNPLAILSGDINFRPRIAFADIDKDGDFDLVVGYQDYTDYYSFKLGYYKNTGTSSAPAFTWETGSANPFSTFSAMSYPAPAFADLDGDGDLDLFCGQQDGAMTYYKNTSTVAGTKSVQDMSAALNVYPNPASSLATLTMENNLEGNCDISIKNMAGVEMMNERVTKKSFELNHTLNTEALEPGIYMIEVKSDSHAGIVKFIKK